MVKPAARPLTIVVALVALLVLAAAGCSSGSTSGLTTPPAGVSQPVWKDYCSRRAALTSTIQNALNGSLSAAALAPQLNGIEQLITQDANNSPDPTKTQFQTLAAGIDLVKVSVSTGVEPDYSQISSVLATIPTCKK